MGGTARCSLRHHTTPGPGANTLPALRLGRARCLEAPVAPLEAGDAVTPKSGTTVGRPLTGGTRFLIGSACAGVPVAVQAAAVPVDGARAAGGLLHTEAGHTVSRTAVRPGPARVPVDPTAAPPVATTAAGAAVHVGGVRPARVARWGLALLKTTAGVVGKTGVVAAAVFRMVLPARLPHVKTPAGSLRVARQEPATLGAVAARPARGKAAAAGPGDGAALKVTAVSGCGARCAILLAHTGL